MIPRRLGVVGAGTMGAGIAQLGVLAGMETFLTDPVREVLDKSEENIRAMLAKGAQRGRWTEAEAEAAAGRLHRSAHLPGLGNCQLVIEAAPEQLELKHQIFTELSDVCADDAVLASNTSSIPITQIAGVAEHPENVVGMHFFNPAPLMPLVEVIAAVQSGQPALELARATGAAMGKHVINASDGPGFLVNRCGRPFYTEALRIVQERLATHDHVDWICRVGAGFRMGPFELMDMVGIDVGYAVARSFMELSFGEPRWKPNPLQAQMVAAGRLGRKTGRGWYDYSGDGRYRPDDEAGATIDSDDAQLLHRIHCCIVNEGAFALGEGVGSAEDIDAGVKLGLNWPKGPIELGRELGFDAVLAAIDELWEHYREERYRAAPLLRRGSLS